MQQKLLLTKKKTAHAQTHKSYMHYLKLSKKFNFVLCKFDHFENYMTQEEKTNKNYNLKDYNFDQHIGLLCLHHLFSNPIVNNLKYPHNTNY